MADYNQLILERSDASSLLRRRLMSWIPARS